MYQHDWIVERLAQERRTEALQHSEHARLISTSRANVWQHRHTWYHALDWLGRQLVRWGEHMQAKHTVSHTRALIHISRG